MLWPFKLYMWTSRKPKKYTPFPWCLVNSLAEIEMLQLPAKMTFYHPNFSLEPKLSIIWYKKWQIHLLEIEDVVFFNQSKKVANAHFHFIYKELDSKLTTLLIYGTSNMNCYIVNKYAVNNRIHIAKMTIQIMVPENIITR